MSTTAINTPKTGSSDYTRAEYNTLQTQARSKTKNEINYSSY
jgi:hypothetical protein